MAATVHNSLKTTLDLDAEGCHAGDVMLKWSDNSNPLGYHPVPLLSFRNGAGPTVLVAGGSHGDEFEGPAAIMRLAAQLRTAGFCGQVIMMPALNAPAVAASSRVSPLDGGNLNRAFTGGAAAGPTAMLAEFTEQVLLPRCDAVIDLHSGGKASVFAPCVLTSETPDTALDQGNAALARAFGLPLNWVLGAHNDPRSLNAAAARAGIPMIAAELGGGGGADPEITALAEAGLHNCLIHMGILPGTLEPAAPMRQVRITSPLHSLYAPADGLFDRRTQAGQEAEAGQPAGTLHFPLEPERPALPLSFPADGFVLAHGNRGMVRRGELLALVAQDLPAPSTP